MCLDGGGVREVGRSKNDCIESIETVQNAKRECDGGEEELKEKYGMIEFNATRGRIKRKKKKKKKKKRTKKRR